MKKNDWTYMAGTEGTGDYTVLLKAPRRKNRGGRVGVRKDSARGVFRIRIEPVSKTAAASYAKTFTRDAGWKQPGDDGQNRFSKTIPVADMTTCGSEVVEACRALVPGGPVYFSAAGLLQLLKRLGVTLIGDIQTS